jgi:hypothetical protein
MRIVAIFSFLLFATFFQAQYEEKTPEFELEKGELEAHLRFLASDDLMGRATGTEGNNVAARYIADHLQAHGFQLAPGLDSYFQQIPLESVAPARSAALKVGKKTYEHGKDFVITRGKAVKINAAAVFAGYGWVDAQKGHDDFKGLDVKGKIVFVLSGLPDGGSRSESFAASAKKRQFALERGAAALFELYTMRMPWDFFLGFINREQLGVADDSGLAAQNLPYGWIKENNSEFIVALKEGKKVKASLRSDGVRHKSLASQNVIGILEGTDTLLRNEYILITAHYDHVGVKKISGPRDPEMDTIFNGARDNAMGVVALMAAAQSLAKRPPKRSVIILAVTGEEIGMVGSRFYANNPLIPLESTVFNLNSDGAGYNDTSVVSILGAERTGVKDLVEAGAHPFGLNAAHNPAPEQNLYDRSDNVSFASKGMPAVTMSPGFHSFDEEILQRYHQVSDEADTIDFDYLKKFCQAFSHFARLVADSPERPWWETGDKYEGKGKELYGFE